MTQQTFFEDLKTFGQGASTSTSAEEAAVGQDHKADKKDEKATKDLVLAMLARQQLPQTKDELEKYEKEIRTQVYKKFDSLIKNTHQYLSYLYLITYNYRKCIEHGEKLLEFDNCAPSTRYNAHLYLAEAKCMIGQFQEALGHLDEAENVSEQVLAPNSDASEAHIKNFVNKVEVKFRTIKVNKHTRPQPGQAPLSSANVDEFLTPKIINKLNRCVIETCSGNLEKARSLFDEVVTNTEENGGLGMREITCECDAA
jgi:tetratricopeptide (TPR) repeat protein